MLLFDFSVLMYICCCCADLFIITIYIVLYTSYGLCTSILFPALISYCVQTSHYESYNMHF